MVHTETIQMVDLQTQYQSIKAEVDAAIQAILTETNFINGKPVKDFSMHLAKYLGVKDVIPCGNGTDALQIALMALDLKPGDEVITSPFTFIATAEVIVLLGLIPVFVDVDEQYFNLDVNLVEEKISDRTRVIMPVHLYGQSAHMEPLLALATKYDLAIIEDNAQAIGADYRFANGQSAKTGTIGRIGSTSFYPSKNLGAYGDGGAICTQDSELAEKMRMICNHGSRVRYYHDELGVNSRLDTIQAAVLDIKLKRLDAYISKRQQAANWYDNGLAGIDQVKVPARAPWSTHVFHQYTLRVAEGRDALKEALQQAGIPSMIYYPVPLHLQPAYQQFGYKAGDFPVSERLMNEVISLPMHTELTEGQLETICSQIRHYYSA
jgi:UDP-2-acetamido-2-deoxy-ribo-hexuluronate aminotransferase